MMCGYMTKHNDTMGTLETRPFLNTNESNLKVEQLDVGSSAMSDDTLAPRVENAGKHDRHQSFVVAVVYMREEGERAVGSMKQY